MENGSLIQPEQRITVRCSLVAAQSAIEFVSSENKTQILSWVTKQWATYGRICDFQRLVRKKIVTEFLRDYFEQYTPPEDRVEESSFKKIVKLVTY